MGLCTPDRMESLRQLASRLGPDVPGDVVEVGVYSGDSLRLLAETLPVRQCWGFDTWEGLPEEQWTPEEQHVPGEFTYSYTACFARLKDLPNVTLLRGVAPRSFFVLEDRAIAFVHLDVDFYLGTLLCLQWLLPRMSPGGIIVLDDFDWPYTPGVKKAVTELGLETFPGAMYQAYLQVQG